VFGFKTMFPIKANKQTRELLRNIFGTAGTRL